MNVKLHDARGVARGLSARMERKFYLTPDKVEMAYGLLRTLCRPDRDYPAEQINSLYFDTADLDELEHSLAGDFRKNKVRIRWYGQNGGNGLTTVFLELKSRQGFASTKQRLKLEAPTLSLSPPRLASGIVSYGLLERTLAGFGYFPSKRLMPVIIISYMRFRFRDALSAQSLALDCHIRSSLVRPDLGHGEREIELPGAVIEIKGRELEIPATLKKLRLLDVDWGQFSKYSACLAAHKDTLGTVGRGSPPGRTVAEVPLMLRQKSGWNRALNLAGPSSCQAAAPDIDAVK